MDFKRTKGIIPSFACALKRLCSKNDFADVRQMPASRFDSFEAPSVTILDYIIRIYKYSRSSYKSYIYAFIYIDRIINSNLFIVNSYNIHRLVITSLMIASKFIDDRGYNNELHSKMGGVSLEEINSLEVEFLFLLNFNLFVDEKECQCYDQFLQEHAIGKSCSCLDDLYFVEQKLPDYIFARKKVPSGPIIRSAFVSTVAAKSRSVKHKEKHIHGQLRNRKR
ncbi:hypothetical protein MHBO_001742 [Bonamia ostreae]|uniref:Cyclin n=1 Tax=Bonamia ostreae TaxID=126728 RepID=A0ABV2AK08_9EUKA